MILRGLVHELNEKGWFRSKEDLARDQETGQQMLIILERINTHLFMTNHVTEALTSRQEATYTCLKTCLDFSKEDTISLWVYEILSVFLESTEILTKNLLILMHQKKPFRSKMTFGEFITALNAECPKFGPVLASQLDLRLRNAVAHAIYWMNGRDDGSIDLHYSDEVGTAPIVEPLATVLVRVRKHNLLGSCLSEVLKTEIEAGLLR